jgi:N-methylhydantoinase B
MWGRTHLSDIAIITFFFRGAAFYRVNKSHWTDIGGTNPGSVSISTEIYQEGLHFPFVKIKEAGKI